MKESMTGELFRRHEASVIRYHASVPDNIRADYQRMFSEMPRDLYEAAITHYGLHGGEIGIARKIRQFQPSHNPFYLGYTDVTPPRTHVQFTGRHDSTEIRPYEDLKRNLFHEIGHNVYYDFAQSAAAGGRNFRAEFASTYAREIEALRKRIADADRSDPPKTNAERNAIRPVADYFMPGASFDRAGAAKEAFCEILSYAANGGVHSFNRPDGTPIDIERDFPESARLVREATASYIARYDPAKAEHNAAPVTTPLGRQLRDMDRVPRIMPPL